MTEHVRWPHRHHHLGSEPHPEATKILAIDGGGIRGVIPAMLVAEIERRIRKPAAEVFDIIAGTSTGGIIALGLNVPGPDGHPKFRAADGVTFYEEHGPKIFARSRRSDLRGLGGLLHEKYPSEGIERALDQFMAGVNLSEAVGEVLVTSYELVHRQVHLFDSRKAKQDPAFDVPMTAAARATAAAPTFFEPALLKHGAHDRVFIDGAVVANNPAMLAFTEVEKDNLGGDVIVVSVGCGTLTRSFVWNDVKDWGLAHWARPLLHVLLDANSDVTDFQLRELLGEERYFRFQVTLHSGKDDLDDASPENFERLREHGEEMVTQGERQLDEVCRLLNR